MEHDRARGLGVILLLVLSAAALVLVLSLLDSGDSSPEGAIYPDALGDVPAPLVMAELFIAEPSSSRLRALLEVLGGVDALTVASAQGAFDLVRFDPLDFDRLLAAQRRSYGLAENQNLNRLWAIGDGEIVQSVWAPETPHDFVHFNQDGTTTMWVNGGGGGFADRVAHVLDSDWEPLATTEPLYASRFAVARQTVFALTGSGVYSTDPTYEELVFDDGSTRGVLASGEPYQWIDTPTDGILVAYPTTAEGATGVWDTTTRSPIRLHALSGQPFVRSAISGDGSLAIGATFDGILDVIDLSSGARTHSFGSVDVQGIDRALTLSHDGSVLVTVEKDGTVTMWWVADGSPIFSIRGAAVQPRWLSDVYAPRSASAVAANGARIALRAAATPESPTTWTIIDTDARSWLAQACDDAGRPLTEDEAAALGISADALACASR